MLIPAQISAAMLSAAAQELDKFTESLRSDPLALSRAIAAAFNAADRRFLLSLLGDLGVDAVLYHDMGDRITVKADDGRWVELAIEKKAP